MSKTNARKRRDTRGFGFLSRAQLLEAKARRLARELASWAAAGGDTGDIQAMELQSELVNEIYRLEPLPRYEGDKVIPPVIGFNIERQVPETAGTERTVIVGAVAIGSALLASDREGNPAASKWFIAPHFVDQKDDGFTWSELVQYMDLPGLNTIEVLR